MTLNCGKVVLNVANCEITVEKTEEDVKLYLQQGDHVVILSEPEWRAVKRASDCCLNFIGEASA